MFGKTDQKHMLKLGTLTTAPSTQLVPAHKVQVAMTSPVNHNAHINIFYLRDKLVEHRVLHERFEAASFLVKQKRNPNFEQMLRQLVDRIPLVIEGDPQYLSILEEIIKLFMNQESLMLIEMLIGKLKQLKL